MTYNHEDVEIHVEDISPELAADAIASNIAEATSYERGDIVDGLKGKLAEEGVAVFDVAAAGQDERVGARTGLTRAQLLDGLEMRRHFNSRQVRGIGRRAIL